MSKRSQKRRGPSPPGDPARTGGRRRTTAAPVEKPTRSPRWRSPVAVAGAVVVVVVVVVAVAVAALALGRGGSSPSPRPSLVAALPSSTSESIQSTTAPGGTIAEGLVAAFARDPFTAHIEQSLLASSITNGARITVTAKAGADVAGRDVAIHITGTGNGPATDEQIVTVGDVSWTLPTKAATWELRARGDVAPTVDGLLSTIRPVDDPATLVDTGIEDLDGTKLHHLTAVGAIAYHSLNGAEGDYDTFDVWATDAGVPVLVKATFSVTQGADSTTGSIETRYSQVGGSITIARPAGAPTPAPSTAP